MSERSQIAIVWWALIFTTIHGLALGFLLHMIPPPPASQTAEEIAAFYTEHQGSIKIGAMIASWVGMFMIPLWAVIAAQIWRQEKSRGAPIWTIMAGVAGPMMGLFLALPPICWGVAAFTPTRAPEITATIHELGMMTLVTTDQIYIFNYVAVVVIALAPQTPPRTRRSRAGTATSARSGHWPSRSARWHSTSAAARSPGTARSCSGCH